MVKRNVSKQRPRKLKPGLYEAERIEKGEWLNRSERPQVLGSILGEDIHAADGWISFVPPNSTDTVFLKLTKGASPYDAIREWFVVRETNKIDEPRQFDVSRLSPVWNFGTDPGLEKKACGSFHLDARRGVSGYPVEAYRAWFESGQRGPYPPDLHALLAPDDYLPFISPDPPGKIPAENRWVYVPIDMARPLEEQFTAAKKCCRRFQDYALELAGQRKRRPKSSEAGRDVLIYTLHYSSGLTVPEIAQRLFPKERKDSAQSKVRETIKRVNKQLKSEGFEPPRFPR